MIRQDTFKDDTGVVVYTLHSVDGYGWETIQVDNGYCARFGRMSVTDKCPPGTYLARIAIRVAAYRWM